MSGDEVHIGGHPYIAPWHVQILEQHCHLVLAKCILEGGPGIMMIGRLLTHEKGQVDSECGKCAEAEMRSNQQ